MSKLFNKSNNQPDTQKQNQKLNLSIDTQGVLYNDRLVDTLKNDHKTLIENFKKIIKAAKNKKHKLIKQRLKAFKTDMEIHNYSEKVQLYSYLKKYYKNSEQSEFVENMSTSSENIYINIISFLKKYSQMEFSDKDFNSFKNDLESIRKIFLSRIEVEESKLYPLYKR